ncbi:MAG TPA: hypothetical protein VEB00_09295 [Clostridia bacterium]|nr:hypothetical protein [Clostridia bacterium]
MRMYLVIMETIAPKREIEVLHRNSDGAEALEKLVSFSDKLEESIVAGKCRVMMITYKE